MATIDQSNKDQARKHFSTGCEFQSSAAAQHHLANLTQGSAEMEYRAAIRLDPKYVRAHFNLGTLLQANGDADGAARSYSAVLRIQPDHQAAAGALGALGTMVSTAAPSASSTSLRAGHREFNIRI